MDELRKLHEMKQHRPRSEPGAHLYRVLDLVAPHLVLLAYDGEGDEREDCHEEDAAQRQGWDGGVFEAPAPDAAGAPHAAHRLSV
jgi:hypothetical protein